MLWVKKAMFTIALINQLFSNQNQTISEPTKLMQSIVMYEYAPLIKIKREAMHGRESEGNQQNSKIKGYDEELEAVAPCPDAERIVY